MFGIVRKNADFLDTIVRHLKHIESLKDSDQMTQLKLLQDKIETELTKLKQLQHNLECRHTDGYT